MSDAERDGARPTFALVDGRVAQPGGRVRLHPSARADAMDMLLAGKTARIEAIQEDFERRVYLVVTLDDDPGRDQAEEDERVPGHRFFFFPDEVELLSDTPGRDA